MKIGNVLVNAAYLGNKVLTAIAVGATKVWEGVSKYIKFKDPVVEQLCMKWSSDGIGLTPEDAAKVTDIGTTFILNKEIVSFDELRYFNLSAVANQAFQGCENLQSVIIPSSATSIGRYAFLNNSSLHSVEIPKDSKLTSIDYQSFSGCAEIKNIYIPPSVDFLGTNAFYNCAKLEYLDIPKTLTSIPDNLLFGCNSLNNIAIPVGATSIGQYAFCNCKKFTLIDIPDKVTSIGTYAFLGCSSIQSFVCRPLHPPTLESNSLRGTPSTMSIYVPDESVDAYKSATNWSAYADQIKPLSEYVEPTTE